MSFEIFFQGYDQQWLFLPRHWHGCNLCNSSLRFYGLVLSFVVLTFQLLSQISLDPIMKWKYRHFPSDFCSKRACFTFPNRRFTGDIAKEAHHVTAVDFMQSFTDKNREINGPKFANIDFVCADVTKLELPKGR